MLLPISRREFFKLAGVAAVGTLIGDRIKPSKARAASGATIRYADRDIPLLFDADVCVCGGGPAGTAAAINAARKSSATCAAVCNEKVITATAIGEKPLLAKTP